MRDSVMRECNTLHTHTLHYTTHYTHYTTHCANLGLPAVHRRVAAKAGLKLAARQQVDPHDLVGRLGELPPPSS